MEIPTFPDPVAQAGLRALATVARADGYIDELERTFIEAIATHLLGREAQVAQLDSIEGPELASRVHDRDHREALIRACVLVALIDAEASDSEIARIDTFAEALGTDRLPLTELRRVAHEHVRLLRFDVLRRSFIGNKMRRHFRIEGLRGMVQTLQALRGGVSTPLADKYRALAAYDEGTLGREYFEFVRRNDFSFPGEAGGPPEPIVFHDCVHVLAGYDTTPIEETQAAAFQAGMQSYDPFYSLLFAFCQFQLGVQISPVAPARRLVIQPELLLRAYARGTRTKVDLTGDWDPWAAFERPVAELRDEYGIEPR